MPYGRGCSAYRKTLFFGKLTRIKTHPRWVSSALSSFSITYNLMHKNKKILLRRIFLTDRAAHALRQGLLFLMNAAERCYA